ncbi:D-arabinono-1,4-lactone oxidase [Acinetobacter terrae]|jgi:FAD-linked oxidoreductase|uniref:D-arabinono-1,4-lactone oxidase n=1 Tax=Acinetobacter terrae TaxID=2731247 RepID=UPI0007D78E15|nr:D-arabinono-1,4-lactone oxidase [Acinetobacter terrae]NNH14492.1 FAD-binding protein [Acinetobacter terrae]OAL88286.1 FAD-linked oxidoreductase [Acinetobacter terrae]
MKIQQADEVWRNWSGSQYGSAEIFKPRQINELKKLLKSHAQIRAVGAGHSFSALVKTDAVLINLDRFKGVVTFDEDQTQCTVQAGTRLYDLGEYLAPINQALPNQGDIDQQSLAGAISTGTHGTGIDLPCLSAFVEGFELLTADGELLQCDRQQNTEIFQAGRVALGSFGILTKITLQNRSRYKLKEQIRLCPLQEVFANIDQWKHQHRHIEFWAFLHSDQVMLKTLDETDDAIQPRQDAWPSEDALLTLCSELTRRLPVTNPYLQKLLSVFVKPTCYVDWSNQIFPTPRNTKFNEMEYQLPVEQGLQCLEEVLHILRKHQVPMFFPIEFRYVKGDDIWLSPFYRRDSVSISIHQFHKQDYHAVFDLVEPILQKYQGRPHWGKLHSMNAALLRDLYPKWDDFMALRQQLDPNQKWLNPHLKQLFLPEN